MFFYLQTAVRNKVRNLYDRLQPRLRNKVRTLYTGYSAACRTAATITR